jgi:hypothetical protein
MEPAIKKALDKENLQGLKDILGDLLDDADYWGITSAYYQGATSLNNYFAIFSCRKLTGHKIYRLIEIREKWAPPSRKGGFLVFSKSSLTTIVKVNNMAKLQK